MGRLPLERLGVVAEGSGAFDLAPLVRVSQYSLAVVMKRRRQVRVEVYTAGTWTLDAGREDVLVEAWSNFASWASSMPGAGQLRLTRDMHEPDPCTSFGEWEMVDAVRAWKSSPEFRERMAQVLQHVHSFQPSELELVAEATAAQSPSRDSRRNRH